MRDIARLLYTVRILQAFSGLVSGCALLIIFAAMLILVLASVGACG